MTESKAAGHHAFGLGASISPSWSSDREVERVVEVASIVARSRASVFLVGDKPGRSPDVRSNAVLLGWLAGHLAGVPRVGSLFLVRQTPVEGLLATARTLGDLIRPSGSLPVIGIMRGRQASAAPMPGPDVDEAAAVLRADPAIPEMELWVGAERGTAIERAGRLADVWLANGYFDNEALSDQMRRFRTASPHRGRTAVRRDFVCHPDSSTAHATVRRMLADGYRGGRFDESVLIAGSPAECLERLASMAELGFDDVLVRPAADGQDAVEQFQMLFEEWTRR
jgi:hypothetical protein